jgi:predicted permease
VARQLLIESLVLGLLGGVFAVFLGKWAVDAILTVSGTGKWPGVVSQLDVRLLGFSLLVATATGILFGLAPAIQSSRESLVGTLRRQSARGGETPRAAAFRRGLVVSQVALSMLLLVTAGLFARTLYSLRTVDPGFRTANLLTFSIDPKLNGYSRDRGHQFYWELLARLRALPHITNAALARIAVLTNNNLGGSISVEGYRAAEDEYIGSSWNAVSPDYFRTMGVPLLRGREFGEQDRLGLGTPKVVIVNEAFEQRYFAGQSALGKRMAFSPRPDAKLDWEIVGVVRNQKSMQLRGGMQPFAYIPFAQQDELWPMTFYVQTDGDEISLGPEVHALVREFDPALPVYEMKSVQVVLEESIAFDRLMALLSGVFALLGQCRVVCFDGEHGGASQDRDRNPDRVGGVTA